MGIPRRRILAGCLGATSLPVAGSTQTGARGVEPDSDRSTPSPADARPEDPVISEVYGKLNLSADHPYWAYEFPLFTDPAVIEYELRTHGEGHEPDVLVLDDLGFQEYKTQIGSFPVLERGTINIPWFGPLPTFTGVNLGNAFRSLQQAQDWTEDVFVDTKALECLTERRATQAAHRVDQGGYRLVFDWTDQVLDEPEYDDVTVDVSIRARYKRDEEAGHEAMEELTEFAESVKSSDSSLVEAMVPVAEEICDQVPAELDYVSFDDINDQVPNAKRVVSVLQLVLDIIADEIGYRPPLAQNMLEETATWVRWGGQVLPVMSNLNKLVDDACDVASAEADTVTSDVENMLMSLGILVAELVMIKYGMVSRVASYAVQKAHTHLLGVVRKVLGLKVYLALLRELYLLTKSQMEGILDTIEDVTRDVVEANDFLDDVDDVEVVEEMDTDELLSLNVDREVTLGPLETSPECHPDSIW